MVRHKSVKEMMAARQPLARKPVEPVNIYSAQPETEEVKPKPVEVLPQSPKPKATKVAAVKHDEAEPLRPYSTYLRKGMSTVSASEVLAARVAQLKQTQDGIAAVASVQLPETQPIIIKPSMPTWEDLQAKLEHVINLPGLWITIRELYEQGYGAELETAAEIALATAKKSPFHLFATMTSKKAGKWASVTLTMVHEAWQVRRNALHVIERLKLHVDSLKAILALSWRLKSSIMRYLGIATEQGTGIKNPAGLFFALTKRPAPA